MARYRCALLLGVDEIEEMAFIARMSAVWIAVIDAGQGVLEGRLWLPRSVNRTTVSALLNETEFFFEQFENVPIVISHFSTSNSPWPKLGSLSPPLPDSINLGTNAIREEQCLCRVIFQLSL